jgi:hypothetical protein
MDDNEFWRMIGTARRAGDRRVSALASELARRSIAEIQAFQEHYDRCIVRAYRWDLWGAAYVMNGGCSDDGFRYFRDWLISEGREVYERALVNPESLAELPRQDDCTLEEYGYVALEAFEAAGGSDEFERDMSTEGATPSGEEWTVEELPTRFPMLSERYR